MGQVFAILVAIKVANIGGPERYLTVSGVAVQSIWRLLGLEIGVTDRCAVCWYSHFFLQEKMTTSLVNFLARGVFCLGQSSSLLISSYEN